MKLLLFIVPCLLLLNVHSWAQESVPILKVGDKMKSFKTTDQHGKAIEVKAGPEHALISFEMAVAKSANKQFEALGANYLPTSKAIYIASIHGMPKIGRFFAMPKMRKYPHQIILADAEGLLDPFPQKKGHVTVLNLDQKGTIKGIQYWDPEKQKVEAFLK